MPWNSKFNPEKIHWPLEVDVDVEYLLDLPINGIGGWQSLLKSLKGWVDEEARTMVLDIQDVERIIRYANCYRTGGFQVHLTAIFPSEEPWSLARYHWCDNVGESNHWDDS